MAICSSNATFRFFSCLVVVILATIAKSDAWPISTEPDHEAILLGGNKKIVFLAGPHNSAYNSVRKFVSKWAKAFETGHVRTKSLGNWRWGGDDVHKLITEPDQPNKEVWDEIIEKFNEPDSNGVILGSAFFDQIGPSATHDALGVMKSIVDFLKVTDSKDVLVIETYRTPRFDQWASMWKHADGEYAESTYEDWLCDTASNKPDEHAKRLDMLGARTNPLGAAAAYLNEGWEVALLETTGMDNDDINIVQVVVTQILQGWTENGLIKKHEYVKNHANEGDREFVELDEDGQARAEELFRYRDCAYQPQLASQIQSGSLAVLYNHSLFSTCDGSKSDLYQALMDHPEIMYSALLSQLKCPNHDFEFVGPTIGQALGYEKQTEAEKKNAEKIFAQPAKKTSSSSPSGSGSPSSSSGGGVTILQITFSILFAYQIYKINLRRPLRKPEPGIGANRKGSTIPTIEMEADPESASIDGADESELVKLAPSVGKGD